MYSTGTNWQEHFFATTLNALQWIITLIKWIYPFMHFLLMYFCWALVRFPIIHQTLHLDGTTVYPAINYPPCYLIIVPLWRLFFQSIIMMKIQPTEVQNHDPKQCCAASANTTNHAILTLMVFSHGSRQEQQQEDKMSNCVDLLGFWSFSSLLLQRVPLCIILMSCQSFVGYCVKARPAIFLLCFGDIFVLLLCCYGVKTA